MNKIFEKLCKHSKRKDAKASKYMTAEDWQDLMDRFEKTYPLMEAILDVELSRVNDGNGEGRFNMAPLDELDEEYLNLFSNPPMDTAARRGKMSYLRSEYHSRIRTIVNALNIEGVNISTYVDMVLTDHFMRYGKQIDRLLQNCYDESCKSQKQWFPS